MKNLIRVLTRRDTLRLSGLALGGLAAGSKAGAVCNPPATKCYPTDYDKTQRYSYFFEDLQTFDPSTPLAPNEMRITFMGSCVPPARRAQQMMSVFVEVGWDDGKKMPTDHFVFDCGSGVCANYGAMGIGFSRMDKVFLAHLHGDHMADLTHIYCFGPSADRKSPLFVWGPGPSGHKSPRPPRRLYDDGTKAFCKNLREACRWHTESFSFQTTSFDGYERPTRESWGLPCDPVPVGDDSPDDGFALVPVELDWKKVGGVGYDNATTHVKITHFPVIHCRKGSIGYTLEWDSPYGPLSVIYTSDTKPEWNSVNQAINEDKGVDVFIHEMATPAEVWAYKNMGLTNPPDPVTEPKDYATWRLITEDLEQVQNSSHTPQGAFGYLLSLIDPRPRLTVATHFPVADDLVECALRSVHQHCPDITEIGTKLTWSFDLMVLRVFAGDPKPEIQQLRAVVSDFGFGPYPYHFPPGEANTPKYHTAEGDPDPFAQIDPSTGIDPGPDTYCKDGY
jgi:ribonuclease Z